jgi:glycosyltransferase involved in cell wall biosynthesis
MDNADLVSVIIPTRNRHDLVAIAINSALKQTYSPVEVIVVIDGPDILTENLMQSMADDRLRTLVLPENVGGSEARNAGVVAANGAWIAFLDDDDEWLPHKLAEQLKAARFSTRAYPVVACKVLVHHAEGQDHEIWPRRVPQHQESASDYLLLRRTIFGGETTFLTSMMLARKELLVKAPFRNIKKHQDWDWLINASSLPGFELIYVDEPLLIFNNTNRPRVSTGVNSRDWESSLTWIEGNRDKISNAAYSSFLCTEVARRARNGRDLLGLIQILCKAVSSSGISVHQIISFFAICLIGTNTRTKLRKLLLSAK